MSFADVKIQTGGMFLKIESGKPQVIRALEDTPFQVVMHGFGKEGEECGGEHCTFCKEMESDGKATDFSKRKQRFKINVWSHDLSKVMIWEFGPQVMELLQNSEAALKRQELNILNVDLMVDASGEGLDKSYSVQSMLKSKEVPHGLALHRLDLPF